MSTATKPVILDETGHVIANAINNVANAIRQDKGTIYGFIIDSEESDPSDCVSYTDDAIGFKPAFMDYANDVFNWGSWEDAFFLPRPCMLKSDGTVDYYLKVDDYSKKIDGTASDIANTAYDGNAMMEWGKNDKKIWIKITPIGDGTSAKIQIADYQVDADFHDWSFHNEKGVSADHFYTPIFRGSVIESKMRSLSGQHISKSLTGTAERAAAQLNNPTDTHMWDIETISDRFLADFLLILMAKSLDTRGKYGQGLVNSGSEAINDGYVTGVHNAKGLFYGTNNGAAATYTNSIKIFGMENIGWGLQWERLCGYINANGVQKVKLTYGQEDGSTVIGYNTDGTGYINTGVSTPVTGGDYISKMKYTKDGMFVSSVTNGSSNKYYCDGLWSNNSIYAFAHVGGRSGSGALCGAFSVGLNVAVSLADWNVGAALSCKPLA